MKNFVFLTKPQVAALNDDDATKYQTELDAYKAQFLADNASGTETVNVDIEGFGIVPNPVNGSPRVSITIDADDLGETFANALCVGERNNVILLAPGRADVIARNSGYANFAHMGITTRSSIDKGSFAIDVALRIEGESWSGKKNGKKVTGTYTSTHLAIIGFTYIPSTEVAAKVDRVTEKAAEAGFMQMMNPGNVAPTAKTVVEPEVEEADVPGA